jgi:replicative DNA helicase
MPPRSNTESRLISALINSQDVTAAPRYGVNETMLVTHANEYRWLVSYPAQFGGQPSVESLQSRFPDFPYSPDYADVAFICSEVCEQYDHRQLVKAVKGASEALYNSNVEEAKAILQGAQYASGGLSYELKNALHDMSVLDTYDEEIVSITMPWRTLQSATGGARPGDLWYVAARLGQGKSWTLGCIARQALLEGKRVALFSLEMPKNQVLTRVHSLLAPELGVNVRHSELHGRSYDAISYRKLMTRIKEEIPGELFIVDSSKGSISPSSIQSMSNGMDLVLVDYVGLLSSPLGDRAVNDWRVMAAISNILKEVAQMNEIPIICAAQINREGENEKERPPKVKNLAQSDALGQDADVVVTHKQLSKTVMIYSVEKNRHGESDVLWRTRFLPNEGRFDEITYEKARDFMDRDEEAND